MRALGANADRISPHARIVRLTRTNSRIPVQIPSLAHAIRETRPDIVHSRNWAAIEGVMAARWVGSCATVHSEHGLDSDTVATEPRRRVWFRRLAYQMADRVLSVSSRLRDLHAARTGFPAHRIAVIHNGVDNRRFYPDGATRARVRQELGISDDEYCIGCVANLNAVKDHPTLLRAVDEMSAEFTNWRLLLIGAGAERAALEEFVRTHPNCSSRVSFLGVSDRVSELLNAMDVWVLPSLTEGISNALLEAMATGLPVVVSDVGGNPEVVIAGDSGLLFGVGDHRKLVAQLLLLQRQRNLRLQLGRRSLQRVADEFSIDSMIRAYECIYERLGSTMTVRTRAGRGM
jgi:glycosyltransferase involved in cell wall biosynthesis